MVTTQGAGARWVAWVGAATLLLTGPSVLVTGGAPEITDSSLPPSLAGLDLSLLLPEWNQFYELSVGAGYKDNILLGNAGIEKSGFASAQGSLAVWRRPMEDGREFFITAVGMDRRYWADRSVDHEDAAQAHARYLQDFGARWVGTLDVEAAYIDQVLDTSYIDTPGTRHRIHGGLVGTTPGVRWKWGDHTWVGIAPVVSRTWLDAPYDSHTEYGGEGSLGHAYGRKSEWRLDYSFRWRAYDSLLQTTLAGLPLAGRSLRDARHELLWVDKHYWDEAHHWFTTTRIRGRLTFDNGSGYYHTRQASVSEQLSYRLSRWEFSVEGGSGYWFFPHQTVSTGQRRTLTDVTATLRCERRLGLQWKVYAEYDYERVLTAEPYDRFQANTLGGGVTWEF
jgi:hypothetical protein